MHPETDPHVAWPHVLSGLGLLEQLLQPLERLLVGEQNAVPVTLLRGPVLVDHSERQDFLGLEEVVETTLGHTGGLTDLRHAQRRVSAQFDERLRSGEDLASGIARTAHVASIRPFD